MGNNTIKTHLVLHLGEDILDYGVPDNVNSSYAESARILLALVTAKNTQKRSMSFTKQAAHRYIENLVLSLANFDILGDSTKMSKWAAPLVIEGENVTSIPKMLLAVLCIAENLEKSRKRLLAALYIWIRMRECFQGSIYAIPLTNSLVEG
jgi:transcriptional regulator of aromatic amino acid metabolism